MSITAISLNDVHVSYGDLKVLQGMTFDVAADGSTGRAVGLLGPNGAGKSTLLKTLLGFLRPQKGSAALFGLPMPERALEARQRLGYMPERDIVSPKVSAVSLLTHCGSLSGMSRVDAMERAHEVLNYVGFGENRYRKMETYSTGMCQRVKFAQALIHDPKLLLLDEPTNGLDPEGRIEMLDLVRELAHKRRVIVLLSSHLLPDVEYVCDRIVVMARGRVAIDDTIDRITAQREGLYELRVRDNREAFMAALESAGCTWRDEHSGNVLVETPPATSVRLFFEIAKAQQTQIRHLRPVRQSLEEAFLQAISANGPVADR